MSKEKQVVIYQIGAESCPPCVLAKLAFENLETNSGGLFKYTYIDLKKYGYQFGSPTGVMHIEALEAARKDLKFTDDGGPQYLPQFYGKDKNRLHVSAGAIATEILRLINAE